MRRLQTEQKLSVHSSLQFWTNCHGKITYVSKINFVLMRSSIGEQSTWEIGNEVDNPKERCFFDRGKATGGLLFVTVVFSICACRFHGQWSLFQGFRVFCVQLTIGNWPKWTPSWERPQREHFKRKTGPLYPAEETEDSLRYWLLFSETLEPVTTCEEICEKIF